LTWFRLHRGSWYRRADSPVRSATTGAPRQRAGAGSIVHKLHESSSFVTLPENLPPGAICQMAYTPPGVPLERFGFTFLAAASRGQLAVRLHGQVARCRRRRSRFDCSTHSRHRSRTRPAWCALRPTGAPRKLYPLIPPSYLPSTSVLPPFYVGSTSHQVSEVDRRYYGGRTEVLGRYHGERLDVCT